MKDNLYIISQLEEIQNACEIICSIVKSDEVLHLCCSSWKDICKDFRNKLTRKSEVPLTMKAIESRHFSIIMNYASGTSHLISIFVLHDDLTKRLSRYYTEQEIIDRVNRLMLINSSSKYEHPFDAAISFYLHVLKYKNSKFIFDRDLPTLLASRWGKVFFIGAPKILSHYRSSGR